MSTGAGWADRTEIRSETSSRIYIVARRINPGRPDDGTWGCSCPAWKRRRTCKHLDAMGLASARPITSGPSSRPAAASGSRSSSWGDSAYRHYDTRNGFGSADEWIRIAEAMAGGRSHVRRPRTATAGLAADLALLGLAALPETIRGAGGLLSAFRAQAKVRHPDHGGDAAQFRALVAAYERLLRLYPKDTPPRSAPQPDPQSEPDHATTANLPAVFRKG